MAFVGCSSSGVDVSPLLAQTTTDQVAQSATDGESAAKAPEQRRPSVVRSLDELLLFQPTKYPKGNWEPEQLTFSDVWMTSKDGTKIHGWFCPTEQPTAVVLYCHGNGG
ncbi:MAG: hypothetical protein O2983_02905, partial [Planctomycetota bacterium]|nr:hypothetical protein [Planctomycetota bacterium]